MCDESNLADRFHALVQKGSDDECWPWVGKTDALGYGRICTRKYDGTGHRQSLTHRIAYQLSTGENISEKVICHKCDNPRCCNPSHLFAGTQGDNIRDMHSKGRSASVKGERNPRAILSESDVSLIKMRILQGESVASIARHFLVGHSTVLHIKAGDTWKWVTAKTELSLPLPERRSAISIPRHPA